MHFSVVLLDPSLMKAQSASISWTDAKCFHARAMVDVVMAYTVMASVVVAYMLMACMVMA